MLGRGLPQLRSKNGETEMCLPVRYMYVNTSSERYMYMLIHCNIHVCTFTHVSICRLVKEGDTVAMGDAICEVLSDKVHFSLI